MWNSFLETRVSHVRITKSYNIWKWSSLCSMSEWIAIELVVNFLFLFWVLVLLFDVFGFRFAKQGAIIVCLVFINGAFSFSLWFLFLFLLTVLMSLLQDVIHFNIENIFYIIFIGSKIQFFTNILNRLHQN